MATDDMTIIPTDQLKAMMAILQSRRVQVDKEIILTDDAAGYLRTANFLHFLGLRPGDRVREAILQTRALSGLSRAASQMDPYLRMQMIAAAGTEDEFVTADPRAYSHGPEGTDDAPADVHEGNKTNSPPKGGEFA